HTYLFSYLYIYFFIFLILSAHATTPGELPHRVSCQPSVHVTAASARCRDVGSSSFSTVPRRCDASLRQAALATLL
ncbi:MAG: hypothetical protein VX121_09740, partial [Pseudomonadota bacterium]|nr:hypothetical protein [Pseudomonadota bacterium]